MTKVIVLGQEPKEEKKLKPIECVKYCLADSNWTKENVGLSSYKFVYLICRNWRESNFDLMICSDYENMTNGAIILGHFNDGIVE